MTVHSKKVTYYLLVNKRQEGIFVFLKNVSDFLAELGVDQQRCNRDSFNHLTLPTIYSL